MCTYVYRDAVQQGDNHALVPPCEKPWSLSRVDWDHSLPEEPNHKEEKLVGEKSKQNKLQDNFQSRNSDFHSMTQQWDTHWNSQIINLMYIYIHTHTGCCAPCSNSRGM